MIGEILLFDYSSTTTEPPTSAQLRFDSIVLADVTKAWIRNLTTDGVDVHELLTALNAGTVLYVQDKNDHTLYVRCTITGAAIDKDSYVEVPVSAAGVAGVLLNNQALAVLVIEPAAAGPPPLPEAAPSSLVTLTQAKQHLRVTWADGDPRDDYLELTLAHAQGAILTRCRRTEYGRTQVDLWTDPDTVPTNVARAILLKLGELTDHRGDDRDREAAARAGDTDESPWIEALLRVYSDPVLG